MNSAMIGGMRVSEDKHRWKVVGLEDKDGFSLWIPRPLEVDAASPMAAVEHAFEKQMVHLVPAPTCEYLGGDIWMVTVAGRRYLAIAPFPAF